MISKKDPVAEVDDEGRALARSLMCGARFAALAVTDPDTGTPAISRIALGLDTAGAPVTLISSLSAHHAALAAHPDCALLVGEPGPKGDPLTHPRLMLQARATFVAPDDPAREALRAHWLGTHPKSRLYVDFADFGFVRFIVTSAFLNAGFGKAARLVPDDLC